MVGACRRVDIFFGHRFLSPNRLKHSAGRCRLLRSRWCCTTCTQPVSVQWSLALNVYGVTGTRNCYFWLLYKHCNNVLFLQGVSIACNASSVLAIVGMSVCPSIRPFVCHTLALCQNDAGWYHEIFTNGQPKDSSFRDKKWGRSSQETCNISETRDKIEPRLLLMINRKSHTRFRLVPKSTTRMTLMGHYALFQNTCVFRSPPRTFE